MVLVLLNNEHKQIYHLGIIAQIMQIGGHFSKTQKQNAATKQKHWIKISNQSHQKYSENLIGIYVKLA